MRTEVGIALITAGGSLGLLTALLVRRRLPGPAVAVIVGSCGAAVGAGGLLVQPDAGVAEWVIAPAALAVLLPLHVRVVLGPLGRPAAPSGAWAREAAGRGDGDEPRQ